MRVQWTLQARHDLARLEEFLRPKSARASARVVQLLIAAPQQLLVHPRMGERLKTQNDVELRRLLVDDYELQYEVLPEGVRIARVFHMREDR
jgi:plasmid stabilization system protein ParE